MISIAEEKEAFIGLSSSFSKKLFKKYPELKALDRAIAKKMTDEYIFYEVILPDYPFSARQLTREFIEQIKEYVIEIRGKK